jgi:predicted oxidoreductase (fatty acid repression mutant protein)
MSNFAKLQETRRTIYALGKELLVSNEEVVALVEKAMKESPSAFNSQSSRAVVLFGAESEAFWNEIAYSELEKVTPAEAFEGTKGRLASFAAGAGTILFFEDQDVVKGLQENFPIWSEQAHGINLYAVWLAFAEKNIGMNVQHYNPLVDAQVAEKYGIPANWKLRAQAPFGSIAAPAGEKDYMADRDRVKVFGN